MPNVIFINFTAKRPQDDCKALSELTNRLKNVYSIKQTLILFRSA